MPGGDRSGPAGMGPMTGRATGYCAGYGVPGYASPVPGYGFGMGRGRGRGGGWGRRNWYYATGLPGWARYGYAPAWGMPPAGPYGAYAAPPTKEQESKLLRSQADWLKQELEAISQRISELEDEA